jgi:bis(5'-nucleosyl)-tetraphosphatase (symmetrical)
MNKGGRSPSLQALLAQIRFDRRRDRVWLTGDLVNRGPRSLDVLRWAYELGDQAVAVLGNHDIHLLALASGATRARSRDTLDEVLVASDRDPLIDWLRRRPLFHREARFAIVHAGILPSWTTSRAQALAAEVETRLRADDWPQLLATVRRPRAPTWREPLEGPDRAAAILAVFTRLRACSASGELCADFAGPPGDVPAGFRPWYAHSGRVSRGEETILFGHWAAHGYWAGDGVVALDSGCVWGGQLTAVRLDDGAVFQQRAID